jgi:hypothetical protein
LPERSKGVVCKTIVHEFESHTGVHGGLMKRGKVKITSELLSIMIFGEQKKNIAFVRDENLNVYEVYFEDDKLEEIAEGRETPTYVLDYSPEEKKLRKIG